MGSAGIKVQNAFHGRNNITCSTNCKYRTAAKLHNIETWFVSGIFENTPHESDDNNNNNNNICPCPRDEGSSLTSLIY